MDLREIGWESVAWMHLVQDRDHWWTFCEHGNEPSGSVKSMEFLDIVTISFSRTLLHGDGSWSTCDPMFPVNIP
jgi:hypothetical protein